MATNVIEKLLVNIEANAAQLQAELAKGGTSVQKFGRETDTIAKRADGIGQRYSQAAVQIASAAENMARAGKVGGGGLKQIVTQGSAMAFMFGPQGAVVGAVGIATLAIIELFRRARDESRDLARQARAELLDIRRIASLESAEARRLQVAQGDRSITTADVADVRDTKGDSEARRLEAQRRGLVDLLRSTAELRREIAAVQQEIANTVTRGDTTPVESLNRAQAAKTRQLAEELQLLQLLEPQYAALTARVTELGVQERNRATVEVTLERQRKAREAAARAGEKAGETAEAQRTAFRDITQAVDDLSARAIAGEVSLSEFDRGLREIGDTFRDKLKQPTEEQRRAFDLLALQSLEVRDILATFTAGKAANELESLVASMTPTVVDDFRVRLRELNDQLTKLRVSPQDAAPIIALQRALADAAVGSEQLEARIKAIEGSAISSFDAQLGLMTLLREVESDLLTIQARAIEPGEAEATKVRVAALVADIERLKQKIKALGGSVDDSGSGTKGAQRLAEALSDAADFALGVSTALVGADATISRMIGGVGQIASGFAKIADLAANAGGLGKLFSTGAGAASALPAIGAAIGGIGTIASLIGREDPAAQALREALDRTAQRLEELTSSVGELVQITAGGGDVAAVRNLVLSRPVIVGRDELTGEDTVRDVPLSSRDLLQSLREAGVSLKELQQVAEDFGVAFANAEFPTAEEIAQLQALIRANGLKQLTDSLAGQLKLLELEARIDPAAFEGIAGVIRRIAVLTGDQGVPALKAALDGINLSTADGPAQAIERLKQLLGDFVAGDLDLSLLGDLNPEEFAETIAQLIESIRSAAPELRTPADKFAAAIEAFGTAVELGTLTAEQKLAKAKDLFAELFPELAAGVDTSSAEAFRQSIRGIIDGFAADGDLSEAEQAQIAVLRALLEAFEGATPAAAQLADALSVLEDRFAIFGTRAAEQIEALLGEVLGDASLGKNAAFGLLRGLTEGLDLATDEGQSALRERAKAIFEALAEGGITAEEQAVVDLLKRILGLAVDVASEAQREADEAARAAEAEAERRRRGRSAILEGAETEIDLRDLDNPVERLRVRLAAVAKAFPELAAVLEGFDLDTQAGRDALEAWIEQIAGSPEALEQLATAMGLSVDELLAALLGLESSADAAADKVLTLAERLGAAFEAADFSAELEGITDPLERLRRTAAAAAGVLPELADIFKRFNVDTAEGRAGAEAALIALGQSTTDAAIRSAVLKLLSQIRGIPAGGSGSGLGAAGGGSGEGRANAQAASTITEVTGNRLVDLFGRNVVATERIEQLLARSLSQTLAVPAPLLPPALPSLLPGAANGPAAGGAVNLTLQLPAIVINGNVTTASEDAFARLIQQRFLEVVQGSLATELLVALRRAGVARSN